MNNLKYALMRLMPPILWDAAARFRIRSQKTYNTWESAAASAGAYDDDLVNRFRVERAEINRKSGRFVSLEGNALSWITALLPAGHLSVTDFGGATGEYGQALQRLRSDIDYIVVENPTLVALCASIHSIRFTTKIPSECDVFFTSSTLQYIKDPYGALAVGFQSARRAVILVRNNFSERETFRVQQSPLFNNGSGDIPAGFSNRTITYPLRTISESRVNSIAADKGFKMIARILENSEVLTCEDNVYGAQLVFLRSN
jgi:putative methyltransferase (TIGR04325 family)